MWHSWLVNAIISSWRSGEVNTTLPKPSERNSLSSMSSGPLPQYGYGVRIIDASRKRSADEFAYPHTSRPAIGCPPMNIHFVFMHSRRNASYSGRFTPHTSTTTAPSLNVAQFSRIHGSMADGGIEMNMTSNREKSALSPWWNPVASYPAAREAL